MSTQITDEAVGKEVVDTTGDTVGMVTAVKHGTARVDPDPGLTETFKAKLDWEDPEAADYPLQEEAIVAVGEDEIRVEHER